MKLTLSKIAASIVIAIIYLIVIPITLITIIFNKLNYDI